MNPKEKVEELLKKYQQVEVSALYSDEDNDICIASDKMYTIPAIQCAIITVEEILPIVKGITFSIYKEKECKFWEEVLTILRSMQ